MTEPMRDRLLEACTPLNFRDHTLLFNAWEAS